MAAAAEAKRPMCTVGVPVSVLPLPLRNLVPLLLLSSQACLLGALGSRRSGGVETVRDGL